MLIPCLLCTFPLLEFDCSICCCSVSSTAAELWRDIQIYAVAGAALFPPTRAPHAMTTPRRRSSSYLPLRPTDDGEAEEEERGHAARAHSRARGGDVKVRLAAEAAAASSSLPPFGGLQKPLEGPKSD